MSLHTLPNSICCQTNYPSDSDLNRYSLSSNKLSSPKFYDTNGTINSIIHCQGYTLNAVTLPPLTPSSATSFIKLPSLSEYLQTTPHISSPTSDKSSSAINTPKEFTSNFVASPKDDYRSNHKPYDLTKITKKDFESSSKSSQKRPRRLHSQVNRMYRCEFPGCHKGYGALNHLNSHILTQGHGTKRKACEFYHLTRP